MPRGKQKADEAGPPSEAESLRSIALGLDRVARAIVISSTKDGADAEQAFYLNMAGFTPSEIALRYGEKPNVISARISNFRKTREKRLKSKEG